MSTRGTIKLAGKYYYITSDAYPSHAKRIIRKTKATKPKNAKEFIKTANRTAGFKWIKGRAGKKYRESVFNEYNYSAKLKKINRK